MRYAVYLRVSTDQQADAGQGLEIQEAACRSWLRQHHHRLAGVYADAGRSGTADIGDRPGLASAAAVLADDRADGLLVYRLDRLARDLVLQEQLLAALHRQGKELRSCSPTEDAHLIHDPDDPQRAMVRRMLGVISQYERDLIRLRLKAGRARKALGGGYVGGGPPYGYAAVRGQLAPLPDEQRALKLMRRMRRERKSYRAIAAELERRGIPPRAPSGVWRPGTIHEILSRAEMRRGAGSTAITAPDQSPEIVEVTA